MFEIDGDTLSTVLFTNPTTQKITFFGATFAQLEKFKINTKARYSIEKLSFIYCKGLSEINGNIKTIIFEISKNPSFSANLKKIELNDNKIESEVDVKDALTEANMENVKLSFQETFINNQIVQQDVSSESEEESDENETIENRQGLCEDELYQENDQMEDGDESSEDNKNSTSAEIFSHIKKLLRLS